MAEKKKDISFEEFKAEVLNDYKIAYESRQASLIGRKEVLTGKAKFGIKCIFIHDLKKLGIKLM